jgi:hypothetical protein
MPKIPLRTMLQASRQLVPLGDLNESYFISGTVLRHLPGRRRSDFFRMFNDTEGQRSSRLL